MVGDDSIDAAAGQVRVNFIADSRFQFDQLFRQVDGNIALLAIDGVQFHRELKTVLRTFAPPVTGHGSHHGFLTRIRHTVLYTSGQRNTSHATNHTAADTSATVCGSR